MRLLMFALLIGLLLTRVMAWNADGKTHAELMNNLRKHGVIKSDRVFNVLLATDRVHYIKYFSYVDFPQHIGYKATISAAHAHADSLELLEKKLVEGAKVLDVGSGSGYLTACFAKLIGPMGKAIGIDHIEELVRDSIRNIQQDDPTLLTSGRLKLVVGDGRQGYPEEAPYDAINVGAAADKVPQALLDQLKPGGRLILPMGPRENQFVEQYDKTMDGQIVKTQQMKVKFVPLTDKKHQWPQSASVQSVEKLPSPGVGGEKDLWAHAPDL
ncbi:protein-L-isoaspartate(D-aspartate) O-methyltransferase-like isoform X3 [Rhinatrema bivittatum]|uniref:protein-L-isoaspartate(D-aspartate) O-methyltransferase-like isoform X3 n=1 Tax=Rhinatrema bivittatum TaxID=194408 RepID=UPI001127877D|nr:protein-L-isoaspartate(D-aspartate) O-methyltransferase-like isoform X3 [Rhinatrema bivittatum]XP_029454409.1 protein-L-isoaspartate(D-aspartate) O-methyltransferase-like isoform X3 [Rhinatrema bivittatum]XP_029454410.1 protein-L-isoaspartate(D-aspartate) O-methyltransferase-like isoform X3 [Rhinatrema bivittatum]XP_029454411.1 protein-L-isoaspartate(D-aspartate) O-methyltransferase-like isoform X3 [Rhinatrema bivittatum]XP_029454412.1 protein-L-isoaspartate(D-aspartate) O-methyltransferase-